MGESISPSRRSWIMSRVGAKNTPPELPVRKVAHSLGLRFRLHCTDLPGKPDIVLPKYRMAIFVHGCFWHRHPGCEIALLGWQALVFWECESSPCPRPRCMVGPRLGDPLK
jgi:DNA mismatch endonuclease (patch repair protein)